MKKNFAFAIVSLAFFAANTASAADGTINFTGTITDSACTVSTSSVAVDFGTLSTKTFPAVGSEASTKAFQISLDSCPAAIIAGGATVRFDAVADTNNPDLLSIGESSDAAGVGIKLLDAKNAQVLPNTDSSNYALVEGANKLNFVAKLEATAVPVTAGTISSSSEFTIVYQ
jgi:major type 1 subunit fimbrin (pilin)